MAEEQGDEREEPEGEADGEQGPSEPLIDQLARNEESLLRLFNALADRIQGELSESRRYRRALATAQGRTATIIIIVILAMVFVIVLSTAYLVFQGFLTGETYVFLLGTLLGSLITFLAERLIPLLYMPIEEEGA